MNYRIISLLFDPRGSINRAEYKEGITILFLLVLISIGDIALNSIFGVAIEKCQGVSEYVQYTNLKPFYIPQIPIVFILFYSSITLAIKRTVDLGGKLWIGVLFGFCTSILFQNISSAFRIASILIEDEIAESAVSSGLISFHIAYVIFGIIAGVSTFIYLSCKGENRAEREKNIGKDGSLTISQFIYHIGNLIVSYLLLSLLSGTLIAFKLYDKWIIFTLSCLIILILIRYLLLVYRRLVNAGKPFYPFILCLLGYIVSLSLTSLLHFKSPNLIYINGSLTLFSIGNAIFIIANILLLLLNEAEHKDEANLID